MTSSGSGADPQVVLGGLLSAVDLSSTAQNRFASAESWLSAELSLGRDQVRATYVSEPKMVSPRLSTPGIVRARPPLVLAAVGREPDLDVYATAIQRKMGK